MLGSRLLFTLAILAPFLTLPLSAQTPVITKAISDPAGSTRFAAGSRVTILGSGFGPDRLECCDGAEPGLEVSVNGLPAAIVKSGPDYTVVRFPVRLPLGPATLRVSYQGRGASFPVTISPFAPAILDNKFRVLLESGKLSSNQSLDFVSPGQIVILSASGLGPTMPEIPTAADVPLLPPAQTITIPTIRIGSISIPVQAARLLPGPASGIYSILFQVPEDTTTGVHRLVLEVGGVESNPMYLPVSLPGIQTTQSGFTFRTRAGGDPPSPKAFAVLNATTNSVQARITATTLSGGAQWLTLSSASVSAAPGRASLPVVITTNPAGLAAGDYYAQITIEGDASNIARLISVVLHVIPVDVAPDADPTGLVFSAPAGQNPDPGRFLLTNPNAVPMAFAITSTLPFVSVNPAIGTIPRGGRLPVTVNVRLNNLPAGVTRGAINVRFPSNVPPAAVSLLAIVTPRPAATARAADANCTPKLLLPTATALGAEFQVSAAWPVPLEAQIVTDCGDAVASGSLTATFSNGDQPVALTSIGDGKWAGTWTPRSPAASTRVTFSAERPNPTVIGTTELKGSVESNPQVPIIQPGGVVSAASFSAILRNAPGEMVSIFGSQLASSLLSAPSLPLPTTLLTSNASLSGNRIPLIFASPNQINAILPYEMVSGSVYQLVLRYGNRISTPESLFIAAAGPAVFSTSGAGSGQGHIYAGSALAAPESPARPRDPIVIYCSGLGRVDQRLANGEAVPASPLSRVTTPLSLSIGGVPAEVLFAGLTPGLVGLYQINAIVPDDAPSGDAVPVLITAGDITSPEITMAIRR